MHARMWPVVLLLAGAAFAQQTTVVVNDAKYASAKDARAAWRPITGTAVQVDVARDGDKPAVRLPCDFATTRDWRVGWDVAGSWDLAACQRFEMDLTIDGTQTAQVLLHLRSGEGWYGLSTAAAPGRRTVVFDRKRFEAEGEPAGWGRIEGFRLSIIRGGQAANREIVFRGLRGIGEVAHVAVYRNDAGTRSEGGIPEYVKRMADALDRLDVAYEILDDREVAAGRLAGKQVAILPLNPVLPKDAAGAIEQFVRGGGRLIVCYCLRGPLAKLLGVRPTGAVEAREKHHAFAFRPAAGEPIRCIQESWWASTVEPLTGTKVRATWIDDKGEDTNVAAVTSNAAGFFIAHVLTPTDQAAKDGLIQEMLGELWPGMWKIVYEKRIAAAKGAAGFDSLKALEDQTLEQMKGLTGAEAIRAELMSGLTLGMEAELNAERRDFRAAIGCFDRRRAALIRAYAMTVRPRPGEIRAVWCHDPAGVRGMSWAEAMRTLKAAGFNTVIANMCWGASSAYPSKVLTKVGDAGADPLAECLAAAKQNGIRVHVWRVNWHLWWNDPPAIKAKMAKAGRLQQDPTGKTLDWLCPSNPLNRQQEIDAMVEIARNYAVDGIHFDYIRYPGGQGCYCPTCRAAFEKQIGEKVARWPADVVDKGPLAERYLQFRRDNITAVVAAVAEQARKVRPGVEISAAVFWNWSDARDGVGQDWRLWVEKGWLDWVCPMQYTPDAQLFDAECAQTTGWVAGRAKLLPGIGATLGPTPDGTLQQVLLARKHKTDGFVLFDYRRALLPHLELLKLGATKEP